MYRDHTRIDKIRQKENRADGKKLKCVKNSCQSRLDHCMPDNGVRYGKLESIKASMDNVKYNMTESPTVIETTMATVL